MDFGQHDPGRIQIQANGGAGLNYRQRRQTSRLQPAIEICLLL
jgi:hypothetical protein